MSVIATPRRKRIAVTSSREEIWWRLAVLVTLAIAAGMARELRWNVVWESAPFLLEGLATSWLLVLSALVIGGVAAVFLAVARTYGPRGLRPLAVAFIEIVRATPELMVVFWVFFALPSLTGWALSAWTAAIAALSVIASAHLAEVIRGGLFSVPRGQWEAAYAIGLGRWKTFTWVILPQALRNMMPALLAQLVALFKATSLVYVIGVVDFFRAVTLVNNTAYAPYALYITLAAGYFTCCWALTAAVRHFDPKYVLTH